MRAAAASLVWLLCAVGPAMAHDKYTAVFNFAGVNCCTGKDCQQATDPKDFEPITNGYKVRSTGEIVPMGDTGFSPDQNWHICRKGNPEKSIRCLLVPQGGT